MPDQTPTPPSPTALAEQMATMYPDDYRAACLAQGALPENATEVEQVFAGARTLELHAKDLFQVFHQDAMGRELQEKGLAVPADLRAVLKESPSARKLNVDFDDRDLAEFAQFSGAYDRPGDSLKHYAADLAKAKKNKEDKDFESRYGTPHGG